MGFSALNWRTPHPPTCAAIDPHLLASLQANDPDLSRRLAFEKWRRKLKVEHFDDATVRKEVVSESAGPACRLEIVCVVPETTGLRVDRLLSTELRLSRSRIQNMQMPDILLHARKAYAGLYATGCM